MNIWMAGIDYSMAGIDIREKFSFTTSTKQKIYQQLKQHAELLGAVLITTCNRTELYLSCKDEYQVDPFFLLCEAIGEDETNYRMLHKVRKGNEVFRHLSLLACGAKSQIWGEDQIITQVKNSLVFAREHHATDSYLEVLFRTAITAAKKIKTQVHFSHAEDSIALKTLEVLKKQTFSPKNILIIGNGEIGKLVANELVHHGYRVTMTLRQYKHGSIDLPQGVDTIDYAERYEKLSMFDTLISATLSPHYTIEEPYFRQVDCPPKLLIDLAVPRDISPEIGKNSDFILYDVDSIGKSGINESHARQLDEIHRIIDKYEADFENWKKHKELVSV